MTNINQEIADLKAKLEELEKKVAENAEPCGFKIRQTYFALHSDGAIRRYKYTADGFDLGAVAQGNAFHTEAEAIRERDKRALLQEMKAFRKGYRFKYDERNFCITCNTLRDAFHANEFNSHDNSPSSGWFPSREEAERAIAHFGDRLNLLRDG